MKPLRTKHLFRCLSLLLALVMGQAWGKVTLTHIHGLAYSGDGTSLYIPSHHGLAIYRNGVWSKAAGPEHDYMGFVATKDRFYSSGHPAPGSALKNPFGLIRSTDGGKTWSPLGLQGETDFHLMAAGHDTNAIYVFNPAPNSRMDSAGMYQTVNDGLAWRKARAQGLSGEPIALAVHPQDPAQVAVATSNGVHFSKNAGDSFQALATGEALAVFFDLDGKHLWYSGFGREASLARVALADGSKEVVNLPPIGKDAVAYIAQNPRNSSEYAIATFKRNVYVSRDGGRNWKQIAKEGQGLGS
ncbi:F510_1955 family glycosylhydrolase [Caldimonas tepidiphila]|uniref:F510_1955 family glycosylhydrolase n=1 Tax=Caldimonas tepidiphila TaxID=2315841 RepID=UPI000E5C2169|nr:glycosyl hydrolase [Caldimonas tepidiphila]